MVLGLWVATPLAGASHIGLSQFWSSMEITSWLGILKGHSIRLRAAGVESWEGDIRVHSFIEHLLCAPH